MEGSKKPDYLKRRNRLRHSVGRGCLLLYRGGESFNENLFYLTGLDSFFTLALISLETELEYIITNPIEYPTVSVSSGIADIRSSPPHQLKAELCRVLSDINPSILYTDYAISSRSPLPAEMVDSLRVAFPLLSVCHLPEELLHMRMIKDPFEVATMKRGIEIIEALFLDLPDLVVPGVAESEIAAEIYKRLTENGFNKFYDIFVASGPNSAIPFYRQNRDRLPLNGVVLIDICAALDYYVCDLTRVFPISGTFNSRQQELYSAVIDVQRQILSKVQPGTTLGGLSNETCDLFARQGLDGYYLGKLGHFVGLAPDDPGMAESPLEQGMVVTIEPGLYLPNEQLGIRMEDMVFLS